MCWFHLCSYMTSAHSARLGATLANNASHRNTHEYVFNKGSDLLVVFYFNDRYKKTAV